jgi:uncharacterized membrane protein YdjX (TVP38/TMEM64 family)
MQPNRKKLIIVAAVIVMLVVIGGLLVQQIPATVSAPLFVLVVVMEVIIAPIPGGAIGYLGAARYGFWTAWPLLYIGNIIGTTIAFLLARKIGAPIFEENVSGKTRARYDALLEGHPLLLWGVYTVPLIPVDVLSVLAGLSHMPARKFLLIAYTGFFFYTAIVAYVGSFLAQFIGVTEAMSAIGGLFLVVLAVWLWRHQRQPAS